jgi:hypothetical protein
MKAVFLVRMSGSYETKLLQDITAARLNRLHACVHQWSRQALRVDQSARCIQEEPRFAR